MSRLGQRVYVVGTVAHFCRTSVACTSKDAIDTFIRRANAERFIEEYAEMILELASYLRIEERELATGGLN